MIQNMRSIDEYLQIITRYDRLININDNDAILTYVWKNLDFEFQRDIEIFFIMILLITSLNVCNKFSNCDQIKFVKLINKIEKKLHFSAI